MKNDKTEQIQTKAPKVTVLMAVYNGERFLSEAVESILAQTFRDFEFLIINDGSTDRTRYILASYNDPRIRIVDNEQNIGLTKSLNRGLALARGEYIARQDADDRSHSSRLEKQVSFMDEHPNVVLLGTQAVTIDESGIRFRNKPMMNKATSALAIRWQLLFDSAFIHTSVMFRRRVIYDLLGGYDENLNKNQDMELWCRVAGKHEVANLPEILVEYRYTVDSISRNYSTKDVQKVKDILTTRIDQEICVDLSLVAEWLEFWHQVTNPSLRTTPIHYTNSLHNLHQIIAAFERCYPNSRSDNEYVRCLASVYYRVLRFLTPIDRSTAFRWYFNLFSVSKTYAAYTIFMFCFLLLLPERAIAIFRPLRKLG